MVEALKSGKLHFWKWNLFPRRKRRRWAYSIFSFGTLQALGSRPNPRSFEEDELVAAVAVGGLSANCVPFLNVFPSSLVAALAAGCALFAVTLNDARGDAARCVCARFVASVAAVLAAAGDAELGKKSMVAARLGGLRLNAFDRRFGISKTVGGLSSASKALDGWCFFIWDFKSAK